LLVVLFVSEVLVDGVHLLVLFRLCWWVLCCCGGASSAGLLSSSSWW